MEPATPPNLAEAVHSNRPPPHILPPPFTNSDPQPILLTQGAEALIFRTHFLTTDRPCILKYRPSKPYRHPTLDARLTRHRILSEARTLVRCRREGVNVPAVLSLNWEGCTIEGNERRSGGWMMMEWIEGDTVKRVLNEWLKVKSRDGAGHDRTKEDDVQLIDLMVRVGKAVGRMHEIGVVHGDLTTSNLMLRSPDPPPVAKDVNGDLSSARPSLEGIIVLIDFGLATQSIQDEDKAVDLYVLERAFGSTHPTAESLFQEVLKAYGTSYRGANVVLKRLEEVRMRGRKRSMLG